MIGKAGELGSANGQQMGVNALEQVAQRVGAGQSASRIGSVAGLGAGRVMRVLPGLVFGSLLGGVLAAAIGSSAFRTQPIAVEAAANAGTVSFYTDEVVPVFKANCYKCHAGMAHRGGFQMDTKAGMFKGGHDGVVVVPGDPDKSLLVRLMRHEGPANDPMPMPPHKDKISDADIAIVAQWVKAGAVMPDDAAKP